MIGDGFFQHRDPVGHEGTVGAVDHRPAAIEHQVAHVRHIGAFEGDHGISAGVGPAVVFCAHPFTAHLLPPHIGERFVGHQHRRRIGTTSRRLDQLGRLLMRHDRLGQASELVVAARVIAVVMGVDQAINRTVFRPFVEARHKQLGGVRKLAIHRNDAGGVDQVTDRASTTGEKADVTPDVGEHGCDWWWCLLLLLPSGGQCRTAKRGGANGNGGRGEKVSSGQ